MKEYEMCLCYLNKKKQEHTIDTSKYIILLGRKACLTIDLVALQAELLTSQHDNIICRHDRNERQTWKHTSTPNTGTLFFLVEVISLLT